MGKGRYVPHPDGVNAAFHAACVDHGGICLQRCARCAAFQHPPRRRCPHCGSAEHRYQPVSGTGTCHSYTVSHRSSDPGWEVPYTTVVVELDEGPRIIAAWEGSDGIPVPGERIEVRVVPVEERFAFLCARRP